MPDILIRGIFLPEGEFDYISLCIYGDGRVYVNDEAIAVSSQRLQDLAISLPEGHGRLGDLDVLEKELAFEYAYAAAKVCHNAHTIIPAEGGEADGNS